MSIDSFWITGLGAAIGTPIIAIGITLAVYHLVDKRKLTQVQAARMVVPTAVLMLALTGFGLWYILFSPAADAVQEQERLEIQERHHREFLVKYPGAPPECFSAYHTGQRHRRYTDPNIGVNLCIVQHQLEALQKK